MKQQLHNNKSFKIFISYSHEDEDLLNGLKKHLIPLEKGGVITSWYDRKIISGEDWEKVIEEHLYKANIILLLISPDFIASDYCFGKEVKLAIKRHESGETRVIPVILRPVNLEYTPFSKLQALPKDAKPVTKWANMDEAFSNVAKGILKVVNEPKAPVATYDKKIEPIPLERPMPLEYFKFMFFLARFSRFPSSHGFDRTSLDWMQRIRQYDKDKPFEANAAILTEGGFETTALTSMLLTRLFERVSLTFDFNFKDSLLNFLRRRRDFDGLFGPLGEITRAGTSPILPSLRHTTLGILTLSYLSSDKDELHKSLHTLGRNFNMEKFENDGNRLMLTAALDVLYYTNRDTQAEFKDFWEERREKVYDRLLDQWRKATFKAGHPKNYEMLRSFSYGQFVGMLDYVVTTTLLLVDLHIPDDENMPEFYLELHGKHCTYLINDHDNANSIPFCNYCSWKKDGPDLGLSTIMFVLMAKELTRTKPRGYFKGLKGSLKNKAEQFRNFVIQSYASPFKIPGVFTYGVSSTLTAGLELLQDFQYTELKNWLEQNTNDKVSLEDLDDSQIFDLLHSELTQDKDRLRCFESTIINRLGISTLRGTRNWYIKHAKDYAEHNPEVDQHKADEFIRFIEEEFGNINFNILDIGCGPGQYSRCLAQCVHSKSKNYHIIGIDYSESMLDIARSMTAEWEKHTGLRGLLEFFPMDMNDIRFPAEFFHGAFAMAPLAHLPKSRLHDILLAFSYVLKQRGVLFINFVLNHHTYIDRERFWELYLIDQEKVTREQIEKHGMEEINRLVSDCQQFDILKHDLTVRKPAKEPQLDNNWYGIYLRKK